LVVEKLMKKENLGVTVKTIMIPKDNVITMFSYQKISEVAALLLKKNIGCMIIYGKIIIYKYNNIKEN
jgi:hypothetical protein